MKLKEGQRVTVTAEGDGQTTMVVSERHRALNSYDLFMGQDGLVVDTSDTLARVQLDDQGIVVVVDRTTLWFALAETTKVWVAVIRHSELPEGEQEITVHATRASAQKEVDCTASALAVDWPEGSVWASDEERAKFPELAEPSENTLGGPVGDWMYYKITQTEVQP